MHPSRPLAAIALLAIAGCDSPQAFLVTADHPIASYQVANVGDSDRNDVQHPDRLPRHWGTELKRDHRSLPVPIASPTPPPLGDVQTLTIDYPTTGAAWDTAVLNLQGSSGTIQTKTLLNGVDLVSSVAGRFVASGSVLTGLAPGQQVMTVDLWSGGASGSLVGEGRQKVLINGGHNGIEVAVSAYPSLGVTGFNPVPAATGSTLTIQGQGFSVLSNLDSVTIGSELATVSAASSVSLSVSVPSDLPSGKYNVWVQVGSGMAGKTGLTIQ